MSEIGLGTKIRYGEILVKVKLVGIEYVRKHIDPMVGVVYGKRTYHDGYFDDDSGFHWFIPRGGHHTCYLVAWDMRRKPHLVPVDSDLVSVIDSE